MATLTLPAIQNTVTPSAPATPLDPRVISFGTLFSPNQFTMEYNHGEWINPRIEPVNPFHLHPATVTLHYAQEIFEGLKAYRHADGQITLFRPEMNARRLARSAARMAMPAINEDFFVKSLIELVATERNYIPEAPGCLYLRPVMFGSDPAIGVHSSHQFIYYVLASPSGGYFKDVPSGLGAVDVLICTSVARAAEGGTGSVKTAANYAVTLKIIMEAKAQGLAQVLFLDAARKSRVEEMGGMNIMFVRNGQVVTPALTDTILPGVTRDSILAVARDLGIGASEETLQIDDVLAGIRSGEITEAIACGTAAVLTGIRSFRLESSGENVHLAAAPGPVTKALYERLVDIQFGRYPDTHNWLKPVCKL